jgi:hypothetical protein
VVACVFGSSGYGEYRQIRCLARWSGLVDAISNVAVAAEASEAALGKFDESNEKSNANLPVRSGR